MSNDELEYDLDRAAIDPVYRRDVLRQLKRAALSRGKDSAAAGDVPETAAPAHRAPSQS